MAGTLGLGALAAPLVGWKNWPAGLTSRPASAPVRLAKPKTPQQRATSTTPSHAASRLRGGATALTTFGLPGAGGGAGAVSPAWSRLDRPR